MNKPKVGDIVRLKPSMFIKFRACPAYPPSMGGDLLVAEIHPPRGIARHERLTVLCEDGQYRMVERSGDLEGW